MYFQLGIWNNGEISKSTELCQLNGSGQYKLVKKRTGICGENGWNNSESSLSQQPRVVPSAKLLTFWIIYLNGVIE